MSVVITDAVITLAEAEQRFHLTRTEDEAFFPEWQADLPALTAAEQAGLAELLRSHFDCLSFPGNPPKPNQWAGVRSRLQLSASPCCG